MPKFSHVLIVLEMFLFFMWLFDDSGRKFISSKAIGRPVCQQKYSFVHRKRIFLYKTVVRSLLLPTLSCPRWRGPRKPLAERRKVDATVLVDVTIKQTEANCPSTRLTSRLTSSIAYLDTKRPSRNGNFVNWISNRYDQHPAIRD